MLSKIIFFTAVTAATIAVILLALLSPAANRKTNTNPLLSLSLYFHFSPAQPSAHHYPTTATTRKTKTSTALVFNHTLTDGPDRRSRVIGKAQGFVIPVEHFAYSAFNIIYLTFDTAGYSGSLGVEAKRLSRGAVDELKVVGGTGSFAFARGTAVFVRMSRVTYHVKLGLRFPD